MTECIEQSWLFQELGTRNVEVDFGGGYLSRRDPVHGLICGKRDPLGQDRVLERDKRKALAAHSTLNRLELSAQSIDWRYNKIQVQPDETEDLIIKRAVKAIPRKSAEIVLDFDATDDPLHGSQEGAFFPPRRIGTTATCRCTVFAVIFRYWPSCGTANAMPARALLKPFKRSCPHSQAFWQESKNHRAGR